MYINYYDGQTTTGDNLWKCPKRNCPEDICPVPSAQCICNRPMLIYIPAGHHIHINCPVHGDVVMHSGATITL